MKSLAEMEQLREHMSLFVSQLVPPEIPGGSLLSFPVALSKREGMTNTRRASGPGRPG